MAKFDLQSRYTPIPDQQRAIEKLVKNHEKGDQYQVLLGVTGSGKTFTTANVIQQLQKPALVMSHNKTLAAQLYQELRDFFPNNAVSYFVSYYDYYQPEAYVPSTDTYIEKDSQINELIDKLRLATTTNLLTRDDAIVVASVSCIYNIGSPVEYGSFIFDLYEGLQMPREQIIDRLLALQYERGDFGFHRGTFRVKGDSIDIFPAYQDEAVRLDLTGNVISHVGMFNPTTGENLSKDKPISQFILYPRKHFMADPIKNKDVFKQIEEDMIRRVEELKAQGKELEARRLQQRVTYDIDQIQEFGFVKGIENYSRYFDGRQPGDAPNSLLEYFNHKHGKDWLLFIDESHISIPQIRGMYAGDAARKQTLVDYGFRLPSAFDNRPLRFDEFMRKIPGFIATSATPDEYEVSLANGSIVEQLVRPTGIPDPIVEIRPTDSQVADVTEEIKKRAERHERTLVTTLTKRTAEDLTEFLKEKGLNVQYLHSDVATLERTDILDNLRRGDYDCLVGINLLREGLDLPEVSLVAILDADKEGFLRSYTSLIQTMGRAARHVEGRVILYADSETKSMKKALDEVRRRRELQLEMNKKFGITPTSINKPIRERVIEDEAEDVEPWFVGHESIYGSLPHIDNDALTPKDKKRMVKDLKREMRLAAEDLNFELAAKIRDKVKELEV
jgi:excinuclease ABC subunit B